MQKIVIDTNIIISAFISPNGIPAKIIDFITLNKQFQICYNADILAEYEEVLTRQKFDKYNFSHDKVENFIRKLEMAGLVIEPSTSSVSLPDESDRIFYDTAKASGATLLTGNTKHYPDEDFIVIPAVFFAQQM